MKHNLRVLIAEDDPEQAQGLERVLLDLRPDWRVVATVVSVSQVLEVQDRFEPDLCFLDVGLVGAASGMTIAREVSSACPVILVTGDPSHALAAFDEGVADFVLKPVRAGRLAQALERAEALMGPDHAAKSVPQEAAPQRPRYLQYVNGEKLVWTSVEEIRFLQAEQKYTRVQLSAASGLIRQGLHVVLRALSPVDFWQIHRSTIVNTKHIDEIIRDDLGRLTVKIKASSKVLLVSKNNEKLFREDFFH